MHYLIVETVATRPHLEAAGEIALKFKNQGHDVSFCWLGDECIWTEWKLPLSYRLLGCSFKKRIKDFQQILKENGIEILSPPKLTPQEEKEIINWSKQEIPNQKALREATFHNATLGMGVLSSIVSLLRNAEYDPTTDKERVQKALQTAATLYQQATKLIKNKNADVVVTFGGRFATSRPIVQAGEQEGIRVLRHERGSSFDKYDLFDKAIHDWPYIANRIEKFWQNSDPKKRKELAQEFYEKKRARIPVAYNPFGDKSYVSSQQQGNCPPKSHGIRRIVFFTSSDDEAVAVGDVNTNHNWENQHAATKSLIAAFKKVKGTELILRLHPNLANKSDYERSIWHNYSQSHPGITVIKETEKVDSYALLDTSDLVITHGSTIGMEAVYSSVPVMLLTDAIYDNTPNIYTPSNEQEILEVLQKSKWQIPNKEDAYPYGLYFYTHGIKYHFYKPTSLTKGTFMGKELPWESTAYKILKWLKMKVK